MKDRFFFEDSLEQHLREKSDEFKMYPSDKIWASIDNTLHARRKRFIAFMAFLVAGILIVAGTEFFGPSRPVNASFRPVQALQLQEAPPLDLSEFNASPVQAGGRTTGSEGAQPDRAQTQVRTPFINGFHPDEVSKGLTTASLRRMALDPGVIGSNLPASLANYRPPVAQAAQGDVSAAESPVNGAAMNAPAANGSSSNTLSAARGDGDRSAPKPAVVTANLRETAPAETGPSQEKPASKILRGDRFGWEIYVTPTMLTRQLSGLEYMRLNPNISNGPITVVRYANVNGFVDNTPAMGYDIGGNLKYRISNRLSVKAGLALNYSRYFIQTYNSQPTYASASVNTYLGYIADSLTSRAPTGFGTPKSQQRLQNQYYTLSVPVGLEWRVAGKGRFEVYLGASIQPGYLLNTNSYTLSSDYSRYEKNASSFNRWNLNTGAEAFISYRVGNTRWELGPQVRYQLFSTYKTGSPIRENMVIYGIRLGFSKSKW